MIACAFTEYTTTCTRGAGGVKRTAGISRSKIASITFTTGDVTAISLVVSSHFAQVLWADNNTATFTESEPTRDSDIKTQEMIANLYGVTQATKTWAEQVEACCEGLVLVHEMNDGTLRIQGIEYYGTTAPTWGYTPGKALVFTGTNNGTLQTKPITTIRAESLSIYPATFVASSLTFDAILLL